MPSLVFVRPSGDSEQLAKPAFGLSEDVIALVKLFRTGSSSHAAPY
jgi:hypothetical protein